MPDTLDKDRERVEPGSHDDLGVHPNDRQAETNDLNRRFYGPSASGGVYDSPGAQSSSPIGDLEDSFGMPSYTPDHEREGDLGSKEEEAGKGPGSSLGAGALAGKAADVVGKGFNPEAASVGAALQGIQKAKNFLWGGKKQKRRTLISGGVIGTVIAIITILFALFLPDAVVSIMQDLENRAFAVAEHDLEKELQKEIQHMLKNELFPATDVCGPSSSPVKFYKCFKQVRSEKQAQNKTTADEDPIEGKGGLMDAWSNSDLAGQYAAKGITFSQEGGKYYINSADLEGGKIDVTDFVKGNSDLFELLSQKAPEFATTFTAATKTLVVVSGSWLHLQLTALLTALYRIHWCVMDCSPGNEEQERAGETTADKQNALEGEEYKEVDMPTAAAEGQAVQDVISGDDTSQREPGNEPASQDIAAGDTTKGDVDTAGAISKAVSALGGEKLSKLITAFKDLQSKGADYMAMAVARAISAVPGIDIGAETITKVMGGFIRAVNIAGLVQLVVQFLHVLLNANTIIPADYNKIHATFEVTEFAMFAATADEQKSGQNHPDLTMLGSIAKGFSTPDKNGNPSSALQSPKLQEMIDRNNSKYSKSDVHTYLENNHYALDGGSSEALTKLSKTLNVVPGLGWLVNKLNWALSLVLSPLTWLMQQAFSILGVNSLISEVASPLMGFIANHLFAMPDLTHLSGEDRGTAVAMGADIAGNQGARAIGGKVDGSAAAISLLEQENEERQQFENRPLFARMFATDTPYSFVSQLSLKMPLSFSTSIQSSFAALIQNPLGKLFSSFASVLHPGDVFAAPTDTSNVDDGGVEQYAIPDSDPVFQQDPETYWQTHDCEQQSKQDYPAWNKAVTYNSTTGQWEHTTTNGCLLIQRSAEAAGALFGGVQDGSSQ